MPDIFERRRNRKAMTLTRRITAALLWGLVFGLFLGLLDCARITRTLHLRWAGYLKPYLLDCLPIFHAATVKLMLFSAVVCAVAVMIRWFLAIRMRRGGPAATSFFHDLPMCAVVTGLIYSGLVFLYHPLSLLTSPSRIAFYGFLTLAGAFILWLIFKISVVFSIRNRPLAFYVVIVLSAVMLASIAIIDGYFFGLRGSGERVQEERGSPNIILIVLDTVRADHFSCYGHSQPVTPVMDRIAGEGMLFKQCISDSIWTLPTHASMFTGLYPTTHHVGYENFFLSEDFLTIAEVLKDRGYQTAGFVANPIVSPRAQFAQGFEYYKSYSNNRKLTSAYYLLGNIIWDRAGILKRARPRRYPPFAPFQRAEDVVTDVRNWFDFGYERDKPFYLFLNFMDAHFPYQPPEPFKSRFSDLEHEWRFFTRRVKSEGYFSAAYRVSEHGIRIMDELYTGSIAYIDHCLGELFEFLKKEKLLDQTALIITSDHGEYFGEHDKFYYRLYHNFGIFNQLLHVPLIIRYPPLAQPGREVEKPVQNVDIFPTILHLAGLDDFSPSYPLHGENLLTSNPEAGRGYAFSTFIAPPVTRFMNKREVERVLSVYEDVRLSEWFKDFSAIQNRSYKYIRDSNGRSALFDLAADPREFRDVTADLPETSEALGRDLDKLEKQYSDRTLEEVLVDADAEVLQHLKELGYIQ
jgi:arylsulfatase A-like enzyme